MLRIGCVEYINAFPLVHAFKTGQLKCESELIYAVPSTLNRLLCEKKLDLALTSSIEYLNGNYDLLPDFCIAAKKQILSVNLYRKKGEALDKIALTHHSATSIALLKVLCKHYWNVKPEFVPLDRSIPLKNNSAFLLIGDEALKQLAVEGFETIDLAESWQAMTGLPFVFAVFSIRKNQNEEQLKHFSQKLESALKWGCDHLEEIIECASGCTGLAKSLVKKYYGLCHYHLGQRELEGLMKFKEYLADVQ